MAKIITQYHCGCGLKTENLAEAVVHSDKFHHSLTVQGTITKNKEESNNKEK